MSFLQAIEQYVLGMTLRFGGEHEGEGSPIEVQTWYKPSSTLNVFSVIYFLSFASAAFSLSRDKR